MVKQCPARIITIRATKAGRCGDQRCCSRYRLLERQFLAGTDVEQRMFKDSHGRLRLLIHAFEEILVGLAILHLVEQKFHRVDGPHLHQDAAQHPHF